MVEVTFKRLRFITVTLVILCITPMSLHAATIKNDDQDVLLTGPTPEDGFIRAFDTYNTCKRYFTRSFVTRENIARKSTCLGYFFGVGSTLLTLQNAKIMTGMCLPQDLSIETMMKLYLEWAEVNIESIKGISATQGLISSLKNNFPC